MKDERGHGSNPRGAHSTGVIAVPNKEYLGRMSASDMTAMMQKYPLVPPSSAPRSGLPDARLASWRRTVTVPGR